MAKVRFEWNAQKDQENQRKHGVSFRKAQLAFADPNRVIAEDLSHSASEKRYYCFGQVAGGVVTVRFTYRENVIRIIGAGYWRKGKRIYERENQIHRRTAGKTEGRS
ncbi:MAG: BrnT family toxin [Candidatus Binatia bacterium]